ncbi:MAG: 30S ribosomal protein S1 [Deltaproteobacteria bacterium]|nr:30S ribosomal protein S1 [Deltaproteobacteria bacterium]
MSEDNNDIDNGSEEDFATLFETYQDVMDGNLQVGDKVRGKIISIGTDDVFVDTGRKIDGIVDKAELLDEQGKMTCQAGDGIELYVVSINESEFRLSRALSGIGGLNILKDAYANEVPVEGKILQTCKGGLNVDLMHRRAFCPISQIDLSYVESAEDFVGQTHHFLITQLEESGKNIVVSRRKLMKQEQEKAAEQFYEKLEVGAVLKGRVTRTVPFGAFVELSAGVVGLVHISELSWSRIEDPGEVVSIGETIFVKITEIKESDTPSPKKIALSVKQVESDPWNTAGDRFEIGAKITGKVTKCVKFGAFVEIAPGIEGLVHISEMSYVKRVLNPEDIVSPGQTVSVVIKEIDLDKRRIGLSLRDAEGDPWLNVPEKYQVGQSVEGSIEKKVNFGYFVTLEPGVTGLLPKSNINKAAHPGMIDKLKEGDAIRVVVEKVQGLDRKITLNVADLADEGDWKNFMKGDQKSMNPLAEKLQKILGTKDQ